jgi:hypothetical protein
MVNRGEDTVIETLFFFLLIIFGVAAIVSAVICLIFVLTRIEENE